MTRGGAARGACSHPHAAASSSTPAANPNPSSRCDQRPAPRASVSGTAEVAPRVSASANWPAVAKRSAGSLDSARNTAVSIGGDTVSRSSASRRGRAVMIFAMMACAVGPVNGGSPASISYNTHPSEDTSVLRRPERHPGLRHPAAALRARGRQGNAEVRHQRAAVVQQDVLGLDVAVDDLVTMRVLQGARHRRRDRHRIGNRQMPLAVEPLAERFALHVRHHVVDESVDLPGVVQRQDVGVLQVCGDADLVQEPFGAQGGRELGTQDLERDLSPVSQVLGEKHRRHAAVAQLPLDPVARSEGGAQTVERQAHEVTASSSLAPRPERSCPTPAAGT